MPVASQEEIERFVAGCTCTRLIFTRDTTHNVMKSGLLPFSYKDGVLQFYVMKPKAKKPELGFPEFQICKGTRMIRKRDGQWEDRRGHETEGESLEPPLVAALREGMEEIGLKLENIGQLYEMGIHTFSSATDGTVKRMELFLAEIISPSDFEPITANHEDTAECAWLKESDIAKLMREDHARIVIGAATTLQSILRF